MILRDKVAVVTGAGSGIGRAIARRFASEGARVVVAEINAASGEETAEQIRAAGGDACAIPTDVGRSESVAGLFAQLDGLGLAPDVLVNNAGNSSPLVPVHETTDENWDTKIRVHLYGTFYGTREALTRMLPRGRGVILNVSSVAGLMGLSGAAAYTAAKGAIIALTKGVSLEVAGAGIRVLCLAPGWVDTPILSNVPEDMRENLARSIPMGRIGTPEEIAGVAAFLASDDASYLTGQVISPNGGLHV